jgi:hypothetical protein
MRLFFNAMFATLLFASACSTPPEPAPTALSETEFKRLVSLAQVPDNPFREDQNLTRILARPELDNEQRLRVLGMRAAVRSTTAANLVGAISDYDQMIRIAPAGHRLAKVAVDEKAYSETQKGYIDRRIAAGPAPNPVQYFNDLMQLGRHADAASFAKASMIDLTSLQAEKLAKAGFLCEGPGYGGRAYRWGGSGSAHTVYWCDAG